MLFNITVTSTVQVMKKGRLGRLIPCYVNAEHTDILRGKIALFATKKASSS
tara:strand:+ start:198 stop:350 length:153 start_codon:yes stop_codon:yes gene_type:complete